MRHFFTICTLAACGLGWSGGTLLVADTQPAPAASSLASTVRAAKSNYQAITPELLAGARKQLDDKLAALQQFLSADAAAEAGWKKFLHWDALEAELARGKDAKPDVLLDTAKRLASGEVGLELPQFSSVRTALSRYAGLLVESQTHDGQAQFQKQLDDLAAALDSYQKSPSGHDADTIGTLLSQLAASGQAPDVVQAIHAQLDQPNIYVRASKDFIATISTEPVDEMNDINDSIVGTQVVGKCTSRASAAPRSSRATSMR